ncbi:DUF935 family protein [candidate division WOR-3 bacterium]|nr:DUF935 family protein [candidate division WOR-3 bacterium]
MIERFINKALQPLIDRSLQRFATEEAKKTPKLSESSLSKMASEFEADFREYIDNPDPILSAKSWDFYKEVARDNQVHTCESVKKVSVLSSPWYIEPASDDDADVKVAEFEEWGLHHIKGTFRQKLKNMLSAFEYGYSITEKTYGYIHSGEWKGKVGIKYLKTRDPEYLFFNLDKFGNIKEIKQEINFIKKRLKESDAIIYSHDSEFENPYGRADVQFIYKPYIMKKWAMRFWSIALERFGMGIMVAKYDRGNTSQITYLENMFNNIQSRTGFIIPKEIELEIMNSVGQGKMAYESALDRYDKAIARGILIPDLLGFSEVIKGSFALGEKHFDIFTWIVDEIRQELQETVVDEQIAKPWLDLNFTNLTHYPKFKFHPLTEDKKQKIIKLYGSLVKLGAVTPIPEDDKHIRKLIEFPEKQEEEIIEEPEKEPVEEPKKEQPEEEEKVDFTQNKNSKSKCQKVIDFALYKKDWDSIEKTTIGNMKNVMERTRDDFLKMVERKKLLSVENPPSETAIEKIQLKHIGDFKKALENGLVNAYLNSKYKSLIELQKIEAPLRKKFAFEDADMIPMDALSFFKDKIPILKRELLFYTRKAFTISGIERERILGEAKIIFYNHFRQGDIKKTKMLLRKLFDKYLETGEISASTGKLLTPFRIQTIVRTNIAEAMNAGRMAMYNDPDVVDFIVAYTLSIVDDDMTSDECRDRIGEVYNKDEFTPPPYHYQCRSITVPIVKGEEYTITKWHTPTAKGF